MRAIITFHSIDDTGSVLSFPPAHFASFLESLANSDIPICDLTSLLRSDTKKGVALTFDDGMRSVFNNALPVIRDLAIPAHLFLTTNAVGKSNKWQSQPDYAPSFEMLDWGEVEKLHQGGFTIESHTNSHPDMRTLSENEIEDECQIANDLIEKRLARRPEYFAYPYGYRNKLASDYIKKNYRAGVTTEFRFLGDVEDYAVLPRLDSYYLRFPWVYRRMDTSIACVYLSLRGFLRRLRGGE